MRLAAITTAIAVGLAASYRMAELLHITPHPLAALLIFAVGAGLAIVTASVLWPSQIKEVA